MGGGGVSAQHVLRVKSERNPHIRGARTKQETVWVRVGAAAAADAVRRLQHHHREPGLRQLLRGREASEARTWSKEIYMDGNL